MIFLEDFIFSIIFLKLQNYICQSTGIKHLRKLLPKDFFPPQYKQTKKETIGFVTENLLGIRDWLYIVNSNRNYKIYELKYIFYFITN